jgi:peptide/nickel transport system substrate-binding protein
MDTHTVLSTKNSHRTALKQAYRSLSPEKVLAIWVTMACSLILFVSAATVMNERFLTKVPTYGGSFSEGVVGTVRFINPVLASTDQDKDLTAIVFAGLTKPDGFGGVINDIAETVTESDDSLHYTVTIKENATFHDGTRITADDVLFTVGLIQNPAIKSPHRLEWEGVTVEKVSDKQIQFTLKQPYPLFPEVLSLGIMPKHIWKSLTDEQVSLSDLNIHAVGSGPYKIVEIETRSGIPTAFKLQSNKQYTLGRPFVNEVTIKTFQNEKSMLQAYEDKDISRIHGITIEKINELHIASSSIHTTLLPRTFAVFFNPNNSQILAEKDVRKALNLAINKQEIIDTVLKGQGKVLNGPFPFDDNYATSTFNLAQAKELLENSKSFKKGTSTLSITLATANTDEMREVATMIKRYWENLGVSTTLSVYELSDLNQSVIKDRDFEALLFGTITQSPSDLYAFWHSSQRNYPGLNISNYVSKGLDENLENLRQNPDKTIRDTSYKAIIEELADETPGVFLFAPKLTYIASDKILTSLPNNSSDSSYRFLLISNWSRYSEKVWPLTYSHTITQLLYNLLH